MNNFTCMKLIIRAIIVVLVLLPGRCLTAQAQNQSPEAQAKALLEAIDKEVDRLASLLDLNSAQIFYVDSIMTHDYTAMQDELSELNKKKVSNVDIYYQVQDKWKESIYVAYSKLFTEEQWAKYLKTGAARDKKSRDKRMAKAQETK